MTKEALDTIKDIIIMGVTPITIAYLAFKQVQIANRQKVIHTQIDGMKSELVAAVAGRENAEGQLKGLETAKQDAKDIAILVATAPPPSVQQVEVVGQTKTVDVNIKKEDTKK